MQSIDVEADDDLVIIEHYVHVYELVLWSPKSSKNNKATSSLRNKVYDCTSELTLNRMLVLTREKLIENFPFRLVDDGTSPLFLPLHLYKVEATDNQLRELLVLMRRILMYNCGQETYRVPNHFVDMLFVESGNNGSKPLGENGIVLIPVRELARWKQVMDRKNGKSSAISFEFFQRSLQTEMLFGTSLPTHGNEKNSDDDEDAIAFYPVSILSIEDWIRSLENDQQYKLSKTFSKVHSLKSKYAEEFKYEDVSNTQDEALRVYIGRYEQLMANVAGSIAVHKNTGEMFRVEYLLMEHDLTVVCQPVQSLCDMQSTSSWTQYLELYFNGERSDDWCGLSSHVCVSCSDLFMLPFTRQVIDILANTNMVIGILSSMSIQSRMIHSLEYDMALSFDMNIAINSLVTEDFCIKVGNGLELSSKLLIVGKYAMDLVLSKIIFEKYLETKDRSVLTKKDDIDSKLIQIANKLQLGSYVLSMPDAVITEEQLLKIMYSLIGSVFIVEDGLKQVTRFCAKFLFEGEPLTYRRATKPKHEFVLRVESLLDGYQFSHNCMCLNFSQKDNAEITNQIVELGNCMIRLAVLVNVAKNNSDVSFNDIHEKIHEFVTSDSLLRASIPFNKLQSSVTKRSLLSLIVGLLFIDDGLSFNPIDSEDQIPECDVSTGFIDKYFLRIIDMTPRLNKLRKVTNQPALSTTRMVRVSDARSFIKQQHEALKKVREDEKTLLKELQDELRILKDEATETKKTLQEISTIEVKLLSSNAQSVPASLLNANLDSILEYVTSLHKEIEVEEPPLNKKASSKRKRRTKGFKKKRKKQN